MINIVRLQTREIRSDAAAGALPVEEERYYYYLGNSVDFWQVMFKKMKSNMWRCRGLLLGTRPSFMR